MPLLSKIPMTLGLFLVIVTLFATTVLAGNPCTDEGRDLYCEDGSDCRWADVNVDCDDCDADYQPKCDDGRLADQDKEPLAAGAIVGIVFGTIAMIVGIAIPSYCIVKKFCGSAPAAPNASMPDVAAPDAKIDADPFCCTGLPSLALPKIELPKMPEIPKLPDVVSAQLPDMPDNIPSADVDCPKGLNITVPEVDAPTVNVPKVHGNVLGGRGLPHASMNPVDVPPKNSSSLLANNTHSGGFPSWMSSFPAGVTDDAKAILQKEQIGEDALLLMDDADLRELGLPLGPRKVLVNEIAKRNAIGAA